MAEASRRQSWLESNMSTQRNSIATYGSRDYPPPNGRPRTDEKSVGPYHVKNGSASNLTPSLESHDAAGPGGPGEVDIYDPNRRRLPFRQRLHHFTWAWYTLSMSMGGLCAAHIRPAAPVHRPQDHWARRLHHQTHHLHHHHRPHAHPLLPASGRPDAVRQAPARGILPAHPFSSPSPPSSPARSATPSPKTTRPWSGPSRAPFWAYLSLTLVLAVGQYSFVVAAHSFGLQTMMPTWILPIFPIMLSGTIASVIADTQPDIAAGLTCQGLGFSVAVMMYAHMVGCLIQSGLPNREHRPGLFMCVGPPAFTALALIGMANGLPPQVVPDVSPLLFNTDVIRIIAVLAAIFL